MEIGVQSGKTSKQYVSVARLVIVLCGCSHTKTIIWGLILVRGVMTQYHLDIKAPSIRSASLFLNSNCLCGLN